MTYSDDYKLRYAFPNDDFWETSDWLTKQQAIKEFEKLKSSVLWIELIYSPIDEDKELDEVCIKYHENRIISVLGQELLIPRR